MLRPGSIRKCQTRIQDGLSALKPDVKVTGVQTGAKLDSSVSTDVQQPSLQPLSRYIPSESLGFLVEDHRLTGTERTAQRVSSVTPWILLGAFALAPYFMMKYNLDKMADAKENQSESGPQGIAPRHSFRKLDFADVRTLLERRTPTLVTFYDRSFHAQVLLLLVREIDNLFARHHVDVNVSVVPYASSPAHFTENYPTAPICQFIVPKNGSVVDFPGPWNVRSLVEFAIPPSRISGDMAKEIEQSENKLKEYRDCLFKSAFVDKKWNFQDSLEDTSVEEALVRCRAV
jgi:hypothetical protein